MSELEKELLGGGNSIEKIEGRLGLEFTRFDAHRDACKRSSALRTGGELKHVDADYYGFHQFSLISSGSRNTTNCHTCDYSYSPMYQETE